MKKQPVRKKVAAPPPPPVVTSDPKKQLRLLALFCAVCAFLLYANTLGNGYTVDDGTVISNNTITKKGISALPEIFSKAYRAGFWERNEGLYRPLSVAMFAVEYQLAPENPAPGHWINVLLYAATAFLLFYFLATLLRTQPLLVPLLATLLFIFHPLHTEVTGNIKSRDEILCFLFSIGALYAYLKFLRSQKSLLLPLACAMYFLAYLSKESAITLLPVFPLMAWYFTDAKLKKFALHAGVFAGVTALYLMIRFAVLGSMTGTAELQLINNSILGAENYSQQLASAFLVIGRYFRLLVFPHPLAFDYSYNEIPLATWGSAAALIPLLLCLLLAWVAVRSLRTKDPVGFGIWFFFISFSLVSNIFFLIESTMAERFLYTPLLGFALSVSVWMVRLFKVPPKLSVSKISELLNVRPVLTVVAGIVLLLFSVKTVSRNFDWHDNITLLSRDVKTCPNSARIRYAYGSALLVEKALKEENPVVKNTLLDQSIAELQRGVSILPNYAEAWKNLGLAYKEKSDFANAIAAFEQARSYKTFHDVDFYVSSGLAYGMGKKYDKALADFDKALEIDPANPEAYNNKGLYLTEMGKPDSALKYLDEAIRLRPDFYQAHYNKGNTFAQMQQYESAIGEYQAALNAKPGYVDAWLNMGNSYAAMQRFADALPWYHKVDSAQPGNYKAIVNLGITYQMLGNKEQSDHYFEIAQRMNGGGQPAPGQ